MVEENKILIGCVEWCAFPQLELPAVKAKVDTGATTSALHAFAIEPFEKEGELWVRFNIQPLQKRQDLIRTCTAPVAGRRVISDSGGHREERYIIRTQLMIAEESWEIEVSLTDRDSMQYRMLLGRRAMAGRVIVNPGLSFMMGKRSGRRLYGL